MFNHHPNIKTGEKGGKITFPLRNFGHRVLSCISCILVAQIYACLHILNTVNTACTGRDALAELFELNPVIIELGKTENSKSPLSLRLFQRPTRARARERSPERSREATNR